MTTTKKVKNVIFDGSCYDYLMRVNGFSCGLNTPPALKGEGTHGLPPYCKRMPYLVDKYPACPSDWMRSEGKIKSYFVPVKEGAGMWLDFNDNMTKTNNVAVVISVQGINPITGLPCKDAQLEQYIEECPKHKTKFGPDRYCKKCDYKWPKQNYLSTTSTPNGSFWLDGFRSIDGIVRQYVLTSDKMKGVASNIIGKDRVFAIGISFFTSKEKKPVRTEVLRGNILGLVSPSYCSSSSFPSGSYSSPMFFSPTHNPINWETKGGARNRTKGGGTKGIVTYDSAKIDIKYSSECKTSGLEKNPISDSTYNVDDLDSLPIENAPDLIMGDYIKYDKDVRSKARITSRRGAVPVTTKHLDISAGAKISQSVYDDTEKLDHWHTDSEGILCINYCTESDCIKIVEQGEIDLEGHPEGFLKKIPVGN